MRVTTGYLEKKYGYTRATIGAWIKAGKLTAWVSPGGHYRIDEDEFKRLLGVAEEEEAG